MNTFNNTSVRTLSIALAALVLLALPVAAPKAHAADMDLGYDYSGGFGDVPSYDTDYSGGYGDTQTYDYSGGYGDVPNYDYSGGYGDTDYVPTDMSYGGGSFGGGFPFSYGGGMGGGLTNTNTNVNTNTNTCTSGSCNTAINAPTTIVTNPAPVVINNSTPNYQPPVYTPVYTPVYQQPTYPIYQQPIAYNQPAPYVSLSAVPYTGLDLGPWGTAAYWGFLILWCLGAAYLIVVKRVQNTLVSGLNGFLFGESTRKAVSTVSRAPVSASKTSVSAFAGIDPFVASQISRAA